MGSICIAQAHIESRFSYTWFYAEWLYNRSEISRELLVIARKYISSKAMDNVLINQYVVEIWNR